MAYKKLDRRARIESKGYKIIYTTSGHVIAKKGTLSYIETSLTSLHKKLFGYG